MQYDYREIYGWMAEGKAVQVVMDDWTTCSQEGLLRHMLNGIAPKHFRLKPRTVKIGSREVEAPVLEPEDGQRLWWWDNYHDGPCDGKPSKDEASNGEWFASAEAARGAYSAYTALLRGDA